MVFSSLPLYHLDPQAWHHQQTNDQQQVLQENKYDYDHTTSSQVPQPQPTPSSEGGVGCGGSMTGSIKPNSMVDRARQAQLPLPEPGLKCPRCESSNTKFCYFNNYNLSQPRHFCKACRRYWTRGGSLRNVPVGGGCRRTAKRSKSRSGSAGPGGGPRSLGTPISSNLVGGGNLLISNNFQQFPFLPSLHNLGNSNPNGIGLNLLGNGGVEMEFPSLLTSFEGLGRINNNGMHHFENNSSHNMNLIGQSFQSKPLDVDPDIFNRRALVKYEDPREVNLSKEFAVVQEGNQHHQQFNWYTNVWSNGSDNLSGFASPSSANHFLG